MSLSRRLSLLIFALAIPLILALTLSGRYFLGEGYQAQLSQLQAREVQRAQQKVQQSLLTQQGDLLELRSVLESGDDQVREHLLHQAQAKGQLIMVMNFHGELRALMPGIRQPDGSEAALLAIMETELDQLSFQMDQSGFLLRQDHHLSVVSLPLSHRNWRGIASVQVFDQAALDALLPPSPLIPGYQVGNQPGDDEAKISAYAPPQLYLLPLYDPTLATPRLAEIRDVSGMIAMAATLGLALIYLLGQRWVLAPLRHFKSQMSSEMSSASAMPALAEGGDAMSAIRQLYDKLKGHSYAQAQRNHSLLRAVNDAVILVDPQGRIEELNPSAERLLGLEHAPINKGRLDVLIPDAAGAALQALVAELANTASVSLDRRVHLQPGGITAVLECNATQIQDDQEAFVGAVLVLRDVTQSEQMRQALNRRSQYDQTTGVLNRKTFENQMQEWADKPGQHAVCYLDLNRFKLINDSCGHDAGDRMLRDVAAQMSQALRKGDTLARIGGDEFGVILPNTAALEAARILKVVMERIHGLTLYWDSGSYKVGVSVGVAFLRPGGGVAKDVFKDAEIACNASKTKGGESQVQFFDSLDQDLAQERNAPHWAMRINEAIVNDDLVLFYQPIEPVDQPTHQRKCEVLLRIREENGKVLAPGQFIAAAERFNLMPTVDRAVIRKAFEWLARHPELWDTQVMSINLSGNTLSNGGLVEYIDDLASRYRIPAETVCFEVTETAALANENRALEILDALRKRGFAFALDDFGSGFASYGYLRTLPVDYVKIDGSFVRNLATNDKDYAIVKSIHDVCQVMGIETVAEFVEDQEILAKLRSIGVNYAQGYGIGRPKDLETYQPLAQVEEI